MTKTKNNHSPPSKRKVQIAKLQQKITARLKQRNTEKRDKDIAKLEARIKNLGIAPLGKKDRLRREIKTFDKRANNPLLPDSGRDYLLRQKEEKLRQLRKLAAEQKKTSRLKKLLAEGFFPGQKKRGVKPTLSEFERKRRQGHRQYIKKIHSREENYLKGLFQTVFGKEKGKENFSVALKRREKYKGKSGWFSKWAKRTERNIIRAEKSLQKSEKKKNLWNLSKLSGERISKKSTSQSWNRWIETETKRLETATKSKQKKEEDKKWQGIIDRETKKEEADTWSMIDSSSPICNRKKDKGQWYWGKYRVTNDYTGEIGIWEEGYQYVFSFDKVPISGLVIDYDNSTIWTERLW